MKQQLPDGYDRFAIPFQCLRKGYGACLYANRLGRGRGAGVAIAPPPQPVGDRTLLVVVLLLLVLLLLFLLNKFFFPE